MTSQPRFDEIVHGPKRLQICAFLAPLDSAEFSAVRASLGVSDSVLSKHVAVLKDAGYLKVRKVTSASRLRTWLSLTDAGQQAFEGHLAALHQMLAASAATGVGTVGR